MNYLPSKKFLTRAFISLLLIGGWFSYSSITGAKITKTSDGTLEKDGGVIVFSRNKDSVSPDLNKAEDWNIEEDTNTGGNLASGETTSINTASIPNIQKTQAFQPYKLSNLNISDAVGDKTSYQKYAKDLVSALKPYSIDSLPNEGYLTLQCLENNTPDELKKVEVMGQIHNVVSETLMSIQVPAELASKHLALINNSAKLSYIDGIMAKAFEKPTEVMDTVNGFKTETNNLIKSITSINEFFDTKGITFGSGEKIRIYVNNIE